MTTAGPSTGRRTTTRTRRCSSQPRRQRHRPAWDRDPSYWQPMRDATPETLRSVNGPLNFDSLLAAFDAPGADTYLPAPRTYR
jgi:hypothetical protein